MVVALTISAAFLWAITNIVDSVIIRRHRCGPTSFLIAGGVVGLFCAGILATTVGIGHQNTQSLVGSVLFGLLLALATVLYFSALRSIEPSIVAALLQLTPLFSVGLGWLIFAERLTLLGYVGAVVMAASGAILSINSVKGQYRAVKRDVTLAVVAASLLSAGYAAQYFALSQTDEISVFVLSRFGFSFLSLMVVGLPSVRDKLRDDVVQSTATLGIVIILLEVLNLLANLLIIRAYSLGLLVLVAPLTALQPLLVLVVSRGVNRLGWLPTDISPQINGRAILAMVSMLLGVYLLATGS